MWTRLSRAGYDVYRDGLNTPAFFETLPDVEGLTGLDVGCGEGYNTRLLAGRGARVMGIDISPTFVSYAEEAEENHPPGILYEVASALDLPFEDASFDFVTAFMSLMDMPETKRVLAEIFRVLRPGGFLQFSISHPYFDTPHRKNVRDEAREGLRPFHIPYFTRILSEWLNSLIGSGFEIERVGEPRPSDRAVREQPGLQDAQVVPYFLHVRARKPSG